MLSTPVDLHAPFRFHGFLLSALLLASLILAGCNPPKIKAGSCLLNLGSGASDSVAVQAVLRAEGEWVVAQRIEPLMALWADGAFVANAKNTPDDPSDDQYWRDKDAIRHRYVRTVFPGAPSQVAPQDLKISVQGSQAEVARDHPHRQRNLASGRPVDVGQAGQLLVY